VEGESTVLSPLHHIPAPHWVLKETNLTITLAKKFESLVNEQKNFKTNYGSHVKQ